MTFVPEPKKFRVVSLEVSLKPFFDNTAETRRAVCRKMFRQWMPLCEHAEEVHVMLWTADGSEILDYRGDMNEEIEWARYLGGANRWHHAKEVQDSGLADEKDTQGIGAHGDSMDPEGLGLHRRPYLYRDEPAVFTYCWFKELVADLKREGEQILERPVKVGNTFDPGPEFAKSPFKYERHREICLGGALYGKTFLGCAAVLNGDDVAYAGFPKGIPNGTSLGTFLGRQLAVFNRDLGLDFVWFSNGFGFGMETWGLNGSTFDGYKFKPEAVGPSKDGIVRFWKDFRVECPKLLVRTRGTNLTTGVDLASDGVPLKTIYNEYGPVSPPVNSPWAALDGDFGLELSGWMSHLSGSPVGFPFRFYTHDAWWMNSPWLDRYQRLPHDLYLPLSVSRIHSDGKAETPDTIAFLSVDDSRGEMPAQVPADVTSHILRSLENAPDAAGPVVWVYPFDEYHEWTFQKNPRLEEVYFGDWYVRGAINQGLPLNTVINTTDYQALEKSNPAALNGSILFTPVPDAGTALRKKLLERVRNGGKVIFYGAIAADDRELLDLLKLKAAPAVEGDLDIKLTKEWVKADGLAYGKTLHHPAVISAGPLALNAKKSSGVQVLASAERDGQSYALAVLAANGKLGWLRGTVTCNEKKMGGPLPLPLDAAKVFPAESLARLLAGKMGGIDIRIEKGQTAQRTLLHAVCRSRNGFMFSGYNPDGVAGLRLNTPHGAPVWTDSHVQVDAQGGLYRPAAAWHHECRVFIKQTESSVVSCKELPAVHYGVTRRIMLKGLKDAVVRFFPVSGTEDNVAALVDPAFPYLVGDFQRPRKGNDGDGLYLEVGPVSGDVLFSW
jgi:hypothetical protein